MKRNKVIYLSFIIITLLIGLSSRKFPQFFHPFLASYSGDTLWALLIFWLMGLVFPQQSTIRLFSYALLFSYAVEISQLYHATWIDAIRSTAIGSLVLGHGFLWSDIICYTVGITLGALTEIFIIQQKKKKSLHC